MDVIKHPYTFCDNPSKPYDKQASKIKISKEAPSSLAGKFASKKYGASFLANLMNIFIETGFDIDTPSSVQQDTKGVSVIRNLKRKALDVLSDV
jgi:hypothetical protein